MKNLYRLNLLVLLVILSTGLIAQNIVLKGKVNSTAAGEGALFGVEVLVQGTSNGTTTNQNGEFELSVASLPVTLVFSYVGYQERTLAVSENMFLNVGLDQTVLSGEDVFVVGSRFHPRTSITTPVPVDNIRIRDLESTAQISFDKMLHYVVPSFNSTQQTISDATAHFDPADLRGLGPSRTLVLINGKRKNPSALVYINDTPGKGDVGVDMNSIPLGSIERVEVLRDGASAQYGSDAIAGVINIILKEDTDLSTVDAFSGVTEEGDGFQFGGHVNTGVKLGNDGFLNITAGYSDQEETNRAGETGRDGLFGAIFSDPSNPPDVIALGESLLDGSEPWVRANPDLRMRVGTPNMTSANIFMNAGIQLDEKSHLYSYGGLVYRDGLSYALYRAPYWVSDDNFLLHRRGTAYQGFQPTFETLINDAQWTSGFRSQKAGWDYDLSYSYGSNSVDYTIGNTLNTSLAETSPTEFNAGGYQFKNNIINLDVSRSVTQQLYLNFGAEYRQENFIASPGEEASYAGDGAQSFPGLQPQNAADASRTNVGAYVDAGFDMTNNIFLGAAARFENYSDFGTSTTFKVNGRIKSPLNRFSLRGSVATGFRAPSLHQIHLSIIQTLVSGGTVSNQGTFDNNSPVLRNLGVDNLKEEESLNFSIGVAARPIDNLFLSLDFFQIDVDDRIVYSSSIAATDTNGIVAEILESNSITSLKFFINAVNTQTRGADFVANYQYEKLRLNAAATFYDHSIEGRINTPTVLENEGIDIFDRKEQSRILSARPNQKLILGAAYDLTPVTIGLAATYFGEVTWQHASTVANDQTFSAKTLLDFTASYKVIDGVILGLAVNNVLGTYPDEIDPKDDFTTDLGGRFRYPWEVNQFGFNGRVVIGSAKLSF